MRLYHLIQGEGKHRGELIKHTEAATQQRRAIFSPAKMRLNIVQYNPQNCIGDRSDEISLECKNMTIVMMAGTSIAAQVDSPEKKKHALFLTTCTATDGS